MSDDGWRGSERRIERGMTPFRVVGDDFQPELSNSRAEIPLPVTNAVAKRPRRQPFHKSNRNLIRRGGAGEAWG